MSPDAQQTSLLVAGRTLSFHEEAAIDNGTSKPLADPRPPKTLMGTKPPIPWKDYTPSHSEHSEE